MTTTFVALSPALRTARLNQSANARVFDTLVRELVLDHLKNHHGLDLRRQEPGTRDRWIREICQRVIIAPDRVTVELSRSAMAVCINEIQRVDGATGGRPPAAVQRDDAAEPIPACVFTPEIDERGPLTILTIHLQVRRHDGLRLLLNEHGQDLLGTTALDGRPLPRVHLVRAIGTAFAWHNELKRTGVTIESLARRCGLSDARVHVLLPLAQLSPELLRAVLRGTLGFTVTLGDLLRVAGNLRWASQAREIGEHGVIDRAHRPECAVNAPQPRGTDD